MELIKTLTPAETYLLKESSQSTFKNLMKYTLIDLFLKRVLVTNDMEHQPHPNDPVQIIRYVSAGPGFNDYSYKPHELPFIYVFLKDPDQQVLFRHLIQTATKHAGSRKGMVFTLLSQSEIIKSSIHTSFFWKLFDTVALKDSGIEIRSQVEQELENLDKTLPSLVDSDPKAASEILVTIGGNIFLLDSFDFELLKSIDSEISKEIEKAGKKSDVGCSCGAGCYSNYDSYSDSFDSGFDSSSGGSSDSADGCSGCGGCGGCGGCS